MRSSLLPPASALLVTALVTALAAACAPGAPEHPRVTAEDGAVRLPLARVADGRVHFFTYRHAGKNVSFLVRTDGRGALHAHLDACWSCWQYRRGYVVEGDDLVCIACRYAYPIEDEEWDFIGACAPISIPSAVEGASLVIEQAVLEKAARYF